MALIRLTSNAPGHFKFVRRSGPSLSPLTISYKGSTSIVYADGPSKSPNG